ncbi:MAG: hypothetical protein Q4G69_13360 [Planctomycetia bacterium]|nr:hypothetical protein [Planctomycetia bacterium]
MSLNTKKLTKEQASEIFMKNYRLVQIVAFENAPAASLTEDIVHDTYVYFVEKAESWEYDPEKIAALLKTITKNMAARSWKKYQSNLPKNLAKIMDYLSQKQEDEPNLADLYSDSGRKTAFS